jgi:hypothetical protein
MDSFDHRKLLNNSAKQERERFKVKDLPARWIFFSALKCARFDSLVPDEI